MDEQKMFLSRLSALAKLSDCVLTKEIIELYDKVLRTVGYPNATRAVEHIIVNRSARDRFPSIADIRRVATGEGEDIDVANEIAGRIFEAIEKFGYNQPEKSRAHIGEIGWMVVSRNGGWLGLLETMRHDQAPTYRAQFRDLALSLIRRHKLGHDLNAAPTFGRVAAGQEVQKFLKNATELIGGTNGNNDN